MRKEGESNTGGELAHVIRESQRLRNSDDVIKVFGGSDAIDVQHLCIDEHGCLFGVGADHLQWVTSEQGKTPEQWCHK